MRVTLQPTLVARCGDGRLPFPDPPAWTPSLFGKILALAGFVAVTQGSV